MLVVGGRLLRATHAIASLRAPRRGHDDNLQLSFAEIP